MKEALCCERTSSFFFTAGIPIENAYLWDDNVKLRENPRVVSVPHFDALPAQQHAAVNKFLDEHCPAHALEEDLVEFMLVRHIFIFYFY